ncbi:hypothetical protein [Aquifex aeolicus]|uniref:Uncharacterized protein aq_1163 n=1 Tax=Aquifex aeolicus (strain VF5) TaxID=224324 RepID=Y1163_AQUAE|nr:hypothetical protein [Aquifex aeolicus]O67227.1 RecName: Full=Uncharacterized protein aq_1163 [Aquifex aeolicus VF5]AAC07189.1 putative protein [Aquifex aeolicus VF5]
MWARVLKLICEELGDRELFLLEADKDLKWFGAPVKEVCEKVNFDARNSEIAQTVKASLQEVQGEGWIVYVDPFNNFADIYEANKPRYRNRWNQERPYDISETRFRVGFFPSREEAYDSSSRFQRE